MQGDLKRHRDSANIFLTVHDVGSSYLRWAQFTQHEDLAAVRDRCRFLHVSLPSSPDPAGHVPSTQDFGLGLVTVLDQLQVQRVLGLGDGVGAAILSRFAVCHPARIHGLVLVNISSGPMVRREESLAEWQMN